MSSIVEGLQADALDASVSVASLLRRAKVVAYKLDLADFCARIERELEGYPDGTAVPPYRSIVGELYALNPVHGWRPLVVRGAEPGERLRQYDVRQPVGEISDLLDPSRGESGLVVPLGSMVVSYGGLMEEPTNVQLQFDRAAFAGILDAVRNLVLDWSLKLEKAGIVGKGLSFSEREKQAACEPGVVVNIGTIGQLTGNVGGISGRASVQTTRVGNISSIQIEELKQFINEVEPYEAAMPTPARQAFAEIRKEVASPTPNQSKVGTLLASLKSSLEAAAGNVIASGVLVLIARLTG